MTIVLVVLLILEESVIIGLLPVGLMIIIKLTNYILIIQVSTHSMAVAATVLLFIALPARAVPLDFLLCLCYNVGIAFFKVSDFDGVDGEGSKCYNFDKF